MNHPDRERAVDDPDLTTWSMLLADTTAVVGDRAQARWLCEVASGLDGDDFRAALDEPATERMVHHLDAMLERLRLGEPLQYVLGRWGFRRLDLMVDRRVLIPRPETELVVELAIDIVRRRVSERRARAVDLGTGSGAIGLALADELGRDRIEVWLTDHSADALDVARANVAGLGVAGAAVRLAHGHWFDALPVDLRGNLDLVVSNPPYIPDDDPRVEPIVRAWEPGEALFAGADGLDAIRHLIAGAPAWLSADGSLVLEIGSGQGDETAALLAAHDYVEVEIRRDLAGHERVAIGRRPH